MKQTRPVIMIIDDAPIPEVVMAQAAEHHARTSEFSRLCDEGHVRVVTDSCASHITVEVQGEYFTDIREKFPTTELMARLQLAIAAGQSCRNERPYDIYAHVADAARYRSLYGGRALAAAVWVEEAQSEAVAQGYSNVPTAAKALTATVKPLKGVRS